MLSGSTSDRMISRFTNKFLGAATLKSSFLDSVFETGKPSSEAAIESSCCAGRDASDALDSRRFVMALPSDSRA